MYFKMIFKSNEGQVIDLEYNIYAKKHDCWENNVYLGQITLKELFINNFKCIEKNFK